MSYHYVKFHDNPPSSLGGDDEQRFSIAGGGIEKQTNKQTNKKKDSKKSTKTIKIPKDSESLIIAPRLHSLIVIITS